MKTLHLLSVLLCISVCSYAKETDTTLAAASIPEALKKNAHAVMRYDKTEVTVKDLDEVIYSHKYALTILDEQGRKYAELLEQYNNLVKIENIKGRLFDKEGKEIRTLKEKEISDYSTFGTSFVYHTDSRIKHFSFQHTTYPYTVVYEIEEKIKTTFFLPAWQAQINNRCAVQSTEFILTYPAETGLRYREFLMPKNLEKSSAKTTNGQETVTWKLRNVAAYEREPYSRTENYEIPTVALSPGRFELLKYKGDMGSWKNLGAFIYELNKDRDILPDDKKAIVKSLTANETSTYAKVQKLYAYMQQNTRYVANEYGIAGWQTFDAGSVARDGYGDCKGLTNYLKALLKEAGINSYAALVYAGDDYYKVDEAFPANTFNHVILCIPQPKDSIWVECTSQQLQAGYLGSFTQGRNVLLVTDQGGYLCSTPTYGKDKSYILRRANLQLNTASSEQQVTLHHRYHGLTQDDLNYFLKTQPEEKIKEMINSKFSFPSYQIKTYKYQQTGTQLLPAIEENADAMVSGIMSSTKKRNFVNLGWMRNPMPEIFQTEARTAPFLLKESFKITDSVTVMLPSETVIESIPKPVTLQFPFAAYHTRFEKSGDQIILIREYEQNRGVYDAALFEKYQQLYRTLNAEKDNLSIVLLNKSS